MSRQARYLLITPFVTYLSPLGSSTGVLLTRTRLPEYGLRVAMAILTTAGVAYGVRVREGVALPLPLTLSLTLTLPGVAYGVRVREGVRQPDGKV